MPNYKIDYKKTIPDKNLSKGKNELLIFEHQIFYKHESPTR